jgi:uncharacterized protein YciI
MQRLNLARDGTDPAAPGRRQAARPAHLETAAGLQADAHLLVGGALTDEAGAMIGSAAIAQFATRAELDQWLRTDPYVTGGVWQDVEVIPYRVAPHYDFPPCPDPRSAS